MTVSSTSVRTVAAAMVVALGVGVGLAQVSIEPPAPTPRPQPAEAPAPGAASAAPATTAPRASTLPSADSVLQGLLRDKPATSTPMPAGGGAGGGPGTAAGGTSASLQPQTEAVAPNEPAAVRLREGQSIYNRTGRLVKDEKTGAMLFVFDADGNQMYDPPMGVVPCRYLAVMEDASENGTKAVKFRISGEVTQYRGKNFLYIKFVQTVRDLGQGLGG
jgi:hypothetical protein